MRKLHDGSIEKLEELKDVQNQINDWYNQESEKVKIQSKMDDIIEFEKVRIYHHELHQKHLAKSSILKLEAPDSTFQGHKECASFPEKSVADILTGPPETNSLA